MSQALLSLDSTDITRLMVISSHLFICTVVKYVFTLSNTRSVCS